MIIKNLDNDAKIDSIIKEQDIDVILTAKHYAKKIRQLADQELKNAKLKIKEWQIKAITKASETINLENQEHLDNLYVNLEEFFANIENNIFNIVYQVLLKLGIENSDTHQIKHLIMQELTKVSNANEITIIANCQNLEKLKIEFMQVLENNKMSCIWKEDATMLNHECICSTKLWTLRLDIKHVLDNVKKLCEIV